MNQYSSANHRYPQSTQVGAGEVRTGNIFAVREPETRTVFASHYEMGDGNTSHLAVRDALTVAELEVQIEAYLQDCDLRLFSKDTIDARRAFLRKLVWFLNYRGYGSCGLSELRQFFYYLVHGHEEPGGRFGRPNLNRPVRPVTSMDYYNCFHTFFEWLVTQEVLTGTPFSKIGKPRVQEEIKSPLAPEHIAALLRAADDSNDPLRNRTLIAFLLDTGCRAGEVVALKCKDVDLETGRCRVLGKGNKYRTVFFGHKTGSLLARLIRRNGNGEDGPLFVSSRGRGHFTRSGLLHLMKWLGNSAGIKDEVSLHVFRRSFAVQMLRNGANVFSVQAMLGHTNLTMTRRYCQVALADTEAQHRKFGPMDRLASAR